METPKARKRPRPVAALVETFGLSPAVASGVVIFFLLVVALAGVWFVRSAPPRKIVITSGPAGSSFQRYADAYQKALAARGVKLEVRPSGGSADNLKRLQSKTEAVDLGFVQSGIDKEEDLTGLVSLGSIAYQPLWVFYRSPTPVARLGDLAGRRIAVGAVGTGTRTLALTLLSGNGILGSPTVLVELEAEAAAAALQEGRIDAACLMGDSAPSQTLRTLMRAPDIQVFNFAQADAYVRRYPYLNKMRLPEGSFDLGKDLPGQDVTLVGPTVELVAREGLNSALSDLLLGVAQDVHGKAGMLQKRGEFPAPLEHELTISEDATRFYKSGKSFIYRKVDSFWLASILNRLLVAIVPAILVLVPMIRLFPVVYRWSIQLRIYRCYRPLLRLERDAFGPLTQERGQDLLRQLDEIEETVNRLKVPASFANQFYELRGHIVFVRRRLEGARPATKT